MSFYLILSHLNFFYLILSYLILFYLNLFYLISSYFILFYFILSYLIFCYLILSYLLLYCFCSIISIHVDIHHHYTPVFYLPYPTYLLLSYLILSYLISIYIAFCDLHSSSSIFFTSHFFSPLSSPFTTPSPSLHFTRDGVPSGILEEALDRAKIGRLQILDAMKIAQPTIRKTVKESAPKAQVKSITVFS